ncbi:MAG TPA: T9SS type A sorting domain-containing protein, partial [Salinivirga sp.]|uniref:T9SS type A sorting domain-containing protein n=1 Tax=Salinivirga sp. TaxID=1970192 RepID=UPI002B4804B2
DPFVGAYEGTTVAGTSVGEAATIENVIMATPKVALAETDEMFHFYGALGNAGVGEHQLDLVYSADGETWTDIAVDIPITGGMELYSYDLSAIPAGAYHIGFRAKVTGDGEFSTLYAIDHVVGPELAPIVTFNVDMNKPILMGDFDPANDTVIVAGDMNGWAEPGTDPSMFMEDADDDGIYTVSMELADGDYAYKYFKGAGWDGGEWDAGDDRMFTVAGAPVTLNDVWANEYLVTFNVMQDGNPAEGATINIDGQDLTTDVDGMAYIGLLDGDYPYTVSLTGFDDITGSVTVDGGNETVMVEFITPIPFPFMDDFEAYAEGDYVAQNSIAWTTWSEAPGTAEDAVISTVHASSGVNSMLISGTNDMVLPLGDSVAGKYHLGFDIYVGTDSSAYWNIQQVLLEEWAFEAYMNNDGTGELNADGATIPFDFELGAWHTVEHYIDLDNDEITLMIDGAAIHTWQYSVQSDGSAGTNQLAALNLYNGGATGTAAYYVDDVMFQALYPVTFNVDMSDAIIDGDFDPTMDTVIVAGSMNGWMEPGMDSTMFMHDMDEDSIYTVEMYLTDGDYEYKYFNGAGWNGGEWEGGDNRMFTVAGAAVVLDDLWAEGVGIDNIAEALDFNIYPNPTNGVLHVEVVGTNQVTIINAIGQVVNTVKVDGHSTLDLSNNATGVYFIRISDGNKVATKRVIVQ